MYATIHQITKGVEIVIHLSLEEQAALQRHPERNFASEVNHVVGSQGYSTTIEEYSFYFSTQKQRALQLDTPETVRLWMLAAAERMLASYD